MRGITTVILLLLAGAATAWLSGPGQSEADHRSPDAWPSSDPATSSSVLGSPRSIPAASPELGGPGPWTEALAVPKGSDLGRALPASAGPGGATDFGFRFVRVRYKSHPGLRGSAWATDYPAAETHLHEAITRTSALYLEGPPIVLTLTDERIFEHPVLYLTEPGYWMTNEEEVESLKKYLARGGFLIIDDFHDYGRGHIGPQWNNMYANIKRVFPDREPVELTADHHIWSIYYDIDPDAAMSTKNSYWRQRFGPLDDIYYGIFDDNGRMMVVICYNQDIGDGWEWPDINLAESSTVSFQMAINFIIYALTH